MIRQFVAAWVALLALVSFSYAKETSVVSFDFYAEFEGFAEDDIPSLPVTFTHPSGTTPINYEDWDNYDWPLRRATKTAQEKVTEGQPIYFSCNFDHEQLDEEFGTNPTQVCEVTVVPPPWANKVIVYETYDTEGGPFISTWIRGEGNRWASAEHYMPSYENYPGYSYSTLPYVVMRVQAWDRDSVYGWFKFEGGGCSSCTTCANHNSGYSPPSISTGSGDSPGFSGSLPFSSECCEDDFEPTSISWQPTTLAGAAQKASISVNSVKLVNGTPNVRYPVDPTEPLQQLKVNSTLGVLATTSSELTWKVYDATDIGAPNFSGEYPLTKTNSDPLPLMEEIKITQESTTSVLYEYKKGGALVSKHRLTYNSTEGSWLNENIL